MKRYLGLTLGVSMLTCASLAGAASQSPQQATRPAEADLPFGNSASGGYRHELQLAQNDANGNATANPASSDKCARMQNDFDIDLHELVKAGCQPSQAQIAKLMDNPVGNLVILFNQFDYTALKGPNSGGTHYMGKYSFMPTFPTELGEDWNMIHRIPISYTDAPVNKDFGDLAGMGPDTIIHSPELPGLLENPYDRTHGMGDLGYVGLASPKAPIKLANGAKLVWGVGGTALFPTAEYDVLGQGKYSVGPTAVVAYLGQDWSLGVFPQHWWSVAGDDDRDDVSLTNIQYFIVHNIPGDAQWRVGMTPNVTVNWKATSDNKVTFPVGLGISRLFKFGQLPVRLGAEVQYSAIHPEDQLGSRWNFRLIFVPVIPTFMF
ncbi:hypothetical protein [Pseudomonas cavernae]|nr:hypothetical protein [Pseudomonas cavernae]